MRFQSTFTAGLLAGTTYASNAPCGTSSFGKSLGAEIHRWGLQTRGGREHVTVDTYVHVIAESDKEEAGYLTEATVQGQIDLLNKEYKPHDFSFKLIETTWTINETWAHPVGSPVQDASEPELRAALRKGGYDDLNLYFVVGMPPLGKCELPVPNPTSEDIVNDGCIMKTMNPGELPPTFGSVTVHEVGHWLGLEHTFENGCEEPGDGVDDTPAEAYPWGYEEGCPEPGRDTCPDQPGLDPVDNFMTYVDDSCGPKKFTAGQAERMHNLWRLLRVPENAE